MLSVTFFFVVLSVALLLSVMLSYIYSVCYIFYCHAKSHCPYAACHYVVFHFA